MIYVEVVKLKVLRIRKGYTQLQLAKRIGVSQVYISKIENGQIDGLTMGKLIKLANVLQVTPEELLTKLLQIKFKK